MSDRRFRFGLVVSLLWLAASAGLLIANRADLASMSPNAWGDFFAGCFAPLAFLWLVLGYLQQGEELRLSTQALRLQAEELRNSVEQQKALVEVSRQQVEGEREALAQERRVREEEAKPVLQLETSGGSFRGDGHSTYTIRVSNVGNIATALVVSVRYRDATTQRLLAMPMFDKGQHKVVSFKVAQAKYAEGCALLIQCRDKLGRSHFQEYAISRESEYPHSSIVLTPVEA